MPKLILKTLGVETQTSSIAREKGVLPARASRQIEFFGNLYKPTIETKQKLIRLN